MRKSLSRQTEQMSKRIGWIIAAISITVLLMGTGNIFTGLAIWNAGFQSISLSNLH